MQSLCYCFAVAVCSPSENVCRNHPGTTGLQGRAWGLESRLTKSLRIGGLSWQKTCVTSCLVECKHTCSPALVCYGRGLPSWAGAVCSRCSLLSRAKHRRRTNRKACSAAPETRYVTGSLSVFLTRPGSTHVYISPCDMWAPAKPKASGTNSLSLWLVWEQHLYGVPGACHTQEEPRAAEPGLLFTRSFTCRLLLFSLHKVIPMDGETHCKDWKTTT